MTAGWDPQGFVLDHLKFVQMKGKHLAEPGGGTIVEDWAQMTLHGTTRVLVEKPLLDPS